MNARNGKKKYEKKDERLKRIQFKNQEFFKKFKILCNKYRTELIGTE